MKNNKRQEWPMLVAIIVIASVGLSLAAEPLADSIPESKGSSISDMWQLEEGWAILDGDLVGSAQSWASYKETCKEGPLTIKFDLKSLEGGLHANINVNGSDRYAIGFVNRNGTLSTYLVKQGGTRDALGGETFSGQSIPSNAKSEYPFEIVSDGGRIQVFLSNQDSNGVIPLIDYHDPHPLPPGDVTLEVLNDSNVRLNRIEVICPSSHPENEQPPNLGVGYFKRPT